MYPEPIEHSVKEDTAQKSMKDSIVHLSLKSQVSSNIEIIPGYEPV